MQISKIKIPSVQTPIDIKDAQTNADLQTTKGEIADFIADKEQGTAAALADLNEKIESFTDFVSEKELAISAAVNDINNKYARVVPTGPQYEAVDLGLPSGIKWANMNVGATSPEDTGLYFTWGSIEGFTKDSGRYCDGSRQSERMWTGPYSKEHGSELGDSQNIPVSEYFDAARKNMGKPWRMPTKAEMVELHNSAYTTWTWTQRNGMNGYLVVSKVNGNSIFLPAAGCFDSEFYDLGNYGYYWESDFSDEESGCKLSFYSGDVNPEDSNDRYGGYSVRAVQD